MSHGTLVKSDHGLRVVIVGGGMIANSHLIASERAGGRLAGVVDRDMSVAKETAERFGASDYFDSISEALELAIDVIHICTPNATHAEFARKALDAGVNVICEKPLCLDADEGARLAALAQERGLVAAVPYIYRYHPLVREIRERRLAGEFGSLFLLHGTYLQDWLISPESSSWRVDPRLGGTSRAFADIGSHWCDLVEWVSGQRITSLIADTAIAIKERPESSGPTFSGASTSQTRKVPVLTEDISNLLFRTDAGTPGTLTISQVSAGRKNRLWFELDGSDGSAVFDQENPETIWLGGEASSQIVYRDPGHGSAESRRISRTPAGHVQGWEACFESFISDVYATIAGEQIAGLPTFTDGARSLQLVDAVLDSARNRVWKEV